MKRPSCSKTKAKRSRWRESQARIAKDAREQVRAARMPQESTGRLKGASSAEEFEGLPVIDTIWGD